MQNPKHPINNAEQPWDVQRRRVQSRVLFNNTDTRMKEKPRWWTIQALPGALCFMTLARTAGRLPTRQGISNQSYILWSVSNAASRTGTSFSTWQVDVLFPSPFTKQLSNSRRPKAGCLTTFIHLHPHLLSLSHFLNSAWLPSLPCLAVVVCCCCCCCSSGEHDDLETPWALSQRIPIKRRTAR